MWKSYIHIMYIHIIYTYLWSIYILCSTNYTYTLYRSGTCETYELSEKQIMMKNSFKQPHRMSLGFASSLWAAKTPLPISLLLESPCLAGWASSWAKETKTPTEAAGTDPEREGPASEWTQPSHPRSKQTWESVSGAAEAQQDTEGMWHVGMTHFLAVA